MAFSARLREMRQYVILELKKLADSSMLFGKEFHIFGLDVAAMEWKAEFRDAGFYEREVRMRDEYGY